MKAFAARQRSRRTVVGCANWELMQATLHSVCQAITVSLQAGHPFLLGALPSNADFAVYGQLRQLAVDPLPAGIVHAYPAVWGWVWSMEDLSGLVVPAASNCVLLHCITPGAVELLRLCSRTYIPFLASNARAVHMHAPEVVVSITVSSALVLGPQSQLLHKLTYCLLCFDSSASLGSSS